MDRFGFKLAMFDKAVSFFARQAVQFAPAFTGSFPGSGLCSFVIVHAHTWFVRRFGPQLPTHPKILQPTQENSTTHILRNT